MDCEYNIDFKKWIPINISDNFKCDNFKNIKEYMERF